MKFCRGDESLEDEKHSGWLSEVDNDNLEKSSKLILLQLHEKLLRNSALTSLWLFSIWNRKGEKVRQVGASWADLKLKNHCSEVLSSLILHNNAEPFLDQTVICDKKWIVYKRWPAQWLDQKEAPKHFPKPNLHPKKSWSLFGGLLPVWFTTTFWSPAKPLHLRSMLSTLMRCTKNCNAYSRYWSTEWACFFSTRKPNCIRDS